MANLEPMPISSLPEGDIQDGDKAIIYRESTGKAYQTTGLADLNADLTDKFKSVNSGSIFDLKVSGVYYIRTAVTDRPVNTGGMYILSYYSDSYNVGLFVPTYAAVSSNNKPYVQVNGTWIYSCDVSAVSTTSLMMNIED